MDDLLAEFVAETREMLEAIAGEIVAWEADPTDRARLDGIFRFVHTVKGNCGFFDFPRLEKLSHAAESVLAEVRAGRRAPDVGLVNAVLAIIDRISQMADAIDAGQDLPGTGDDDLIAALEPDATEPEGDEVGAAASGATMQDDTNEKTIGANQTVTPRSIRLPVELLDRVMSGISDMVLARNDLARRLRDAGAQPTIDGPFERLTGILTDVREAVTRMRMQRIEHLYNALPRLVRDLSADLGKQVMIDLEGGDVELDREMIEMIRDPVTHIIRNAIDHGIETPATRLAVGKREIGLLSFAARQSGNKITITITDDGRGLDLAKLASKAVAAHIVSQREADEMSRNQLQQLIFEPGLSTADTVSNVSGRGVGMDVVRANLEKIGGTIQVRSKAGEGTLFILEIPLTLSIVAGLTVGAEGQRFAIPRSYVEEIVHGAAASLVYSTVGDSELVTFRGKRIACLSLANVLGMTRGQSVRGKTLVLVRLGSGDLFAVAVDRIYDHEDLVVKPLAPAVMATGVYAGTTLLDDGSPILMLDMPTIAQQNGLVSEVRLRPASVEPEDVEVSEKTRPVMLFVGIDGRRRAMDMDIVRRIDIAPVAAIDIEGARAQIVIDGEILPLVGAYGGAMPADKLKLLRLSDGTCELAYAVREVSDAAVIDSAIVPAGADDDLIEGVTLIGGEPVGIIDGMKMFARHGSPPQSSVPLVCRLPAADGWARTMLEPLVKAAGYRLAASDDEAADVTILMENDDAETSDHDGQIICLHADAEAPVSTADRIYRYDRDALLGALRTARGGRP